MPNEQYPKRFSPDPSPELSPTILPPVQASPARYQPWVGYGANILLGLGLLLAGLPMAWLLGTGLARVVAAPAHQLPLQEIFLRRTHRVLTELHRLPSRWQPTPPLETRIEPIPIPTQPIAPLTQPPAVLNTREQQIANEELAALQQEFETIGKRLSDLESKLGQAQSTAAVESRLNHLEQRLTPVQPYPSATLPIPSPTSAPGAATTPPAPNALKTQYPLLETTELKITLPSDALFAPGEARLLATAPGLLTSIFADLAPYPKATILLGSHTDDQMPPSQSRELAFQQANALRAYLSGNLPDHRWVTLGYGQSRPLTDNSTPPLRQRNRRIEIVIDRR